MTLTVPADRPAAGKPMTQDEAVRAEQIRVLIEVRSNRYLTLLAPFIDLAAFWHVYPAWVLATWFALFIAILELRIYLGHRYRAAPRSPQEVRKWGAMLAAGAGATGFLWGCVGTVLLITNSPVPQFFSILSVTGLMAAGVMMNAAYAPAMAAYAIPCILPSIIILISRADLQHAGFGFMLAFFGIFMISAALKHGRSITQNIRFQLERDGLLEKVQSSEAAMAEAQKLAQTGSWVLDLRTNIISLSAEAHRNFGIDPANGAPDFRLIMARVHPDDKAAVNAYIANGKAEAAHDGIDHRLVMDDGTIKHVHISSKTILDNSGRPVRVVGSVQDITARKHAAEKLQLANILLKTQMEASPDGIFVVSENQVIAYNQRFLDMWSLSGPELRTAPPGWFRDRTMKFLKDPETFKATIAHLIRHPDETTDDVLETIDGRTIERHGVSLLVPGQNLGRAWFFRDVTARREAEALALRLARHDPLTGLANRALFVEALQKAIAHAKRETTRFAVLFLDLDRFKQVNDTLGHAAGDVLLKAVAARLLAATRETDTIARFGGDEFAVILSGIQDAAGAVVLAERVLAALNRPLTIDTNAVHVRASIGIELFSPAAEDPETLLAHADAALYRAKAEGRGTFRFYTGVMDNKFAG